MVQANVLKKIALASLFAVFVVLSVYYSFAALPDTVGAGVRLGLPNSSRTGLVDINASNLSGTVTFYLNVSLTGAGTNITNVTFYYNDSTSPWSGVISWGLIGHNTTFNISEEINSTGYKIVWDTTTVTDRNRTVTINVTVRGNASAGQGAATPPAWIQTTASLAVNITIDNTAPLDIRLQGYAWDKAGEFFNGTHYRNNGTGIRFNVSARDNIADYR